MKEYTGVASFDRDAALQQRPVSGRRPASGTYSAAYKVNSPVPRASLIGLVALTGLTVMPGVLEAQQFVVDDAVPVAHRACQLEVWHSAQGGWAMTACQPVRRLEISPGIGWIRNAEDEWTIDLALQAMYVAREPQPNSFGWGLIAGAGFGPPAWALGHRIHEFFAFVPLTISRCDDRLALHLNAGWSMEREEFAGTTALFGARHHGTWGARCDLVVTDRLTLTGEFFGEDRTRPEYQVGVFSALIPERLLMVVSLGKHSNGLPEQEPVGIILGFAWTPAPAP